MGPLSFVSWVNGLVPEDLETYSRDIDAWHGAYSQWLQTLPRASQGLKTAVRRQVPNRLHWSLVQGKAYELWLGASGKTCKAPLRTYLQARGGPGAGVPCKKDKVALARQLKQWRSHKAANEGFGAVVIANPSGRRKLRARGCARTPSHAAPGGWSGLQGS